MRIEKVRSNNLMSILGKLLILAAVNSGIVPNITEIVGITYMSKDKFVTRFVTHGNLYCHDYLRPVIQLFDRVSRVEHSALRCFITIPNWRTNGLNIKDFSARECIKITIKILIVVYKTFF